jgi:predicted Zn-dependent protease
MQVVAMKLAALAAALVVLEGCGTTTAPGAVGVSRSQLLIVTSAEVNQEAAMLFARETAQARAQNRLNKDAAEVQRVRAITAQLVREVSTFREDAKGWAWEVNVFDDASPNAFCLPGGKMAVNTGLLKLPVTDAELAAVMSHEIAHALREHGREKRSQDVLAKAVVRAVATSGSRNAGVNADLTKIGAHLLVTLPYSRDMESEADMLGLELMARAGFEPLAAVTFWQKMMAAGTAGNRPEFLRTHPSHERRIAGIEAAAPRVQTLYEAATANVPKGPLPYVAGAAVAPGGTTGAVGLALAPAVRPIGQALVAPSAAPAVKQVGQESFQVEQLGRREGCDTTAEASLTAKGPGFELYTLACKRDVVWAVRCEFGNCRALK